MARLNIAFPRALDTAANPAPGGFLYVFDAGTTTPVTTYSDLDLTLVQSKPVVADGSGIFPDSYLPQGSYKVQIKTSGGVLIYEADNVAVDADLGTILTIDQFTGNGINKGFTLSASPSSKTHTIASINGITQHQTRYSVASNVLTFETAPPNGSFIQTMIFNTVTLSTMTAGAITTTDGENVQAKLDQAFYTARALFKADVDAGKVWADGDVVRAGKLLFLKSTGATTISDLPNWLPLGDVSPLHYADNATPGTTDMRTAANSAKNYAGDIYIDEIMLIGSNINLNGNTHFKSGGQIVAGTGATITISGHVFASESQHIFAWSGTGNYSVSKMDHVYIDWFGALNDASTDNAPTVLMAWESLTKGSVRVGEGTYAFASTMATTSDLKKFKGSGSGRSKFRKDILNDNMMEFNAPDIATTPIENVGIEDIECIINTSDIHTAGAFFKINVSQNLTIDRVNTYNGFNGIEIVCGRQIIMNDCLIETNSSNPAVSGTGLAFKDLTGAVSRRNVGVINNVRIRNASSSTAERFTTDIEVGSADGLTFIACYAGNASTTGIKIEPQEADSSITGVYWNDGWLDPGRTGTAVLFDVTGETTGKLTTIQINAGIVNGGTEAEAGIKVHPTGTQIISGITINSVQFKNTLGRLIEIKSDGTGGVHDVVINGNNARNGQIDGAGAESFFEIDDCDTMAINGNNASWGGTFGAAHVTSGADYALTLGANCANFAVTGNVFVGHGTGGINNLAGTSTSKVVANNAV